jgi:ribonuclease T2
MRWRRDLTRGLRPSGLLSAVMLLALSPAWRADADGRDVGARPPGAFDYYVLSLSWVPGFCAIHRGRASECAMGLGFALHGLWPQSNDGAYPTDCETLPLTRDDIERYADLYPSPSLIAHEWRKHGTCSGLPPRAYFALAARDFRRIRIPAIDGRDGALRATEADRVKSAFLAANPGLPRTAITTVAAQGLLAEVHLCLTKAGAFRPC